MCATSGPYILLFTTSSSFFFFFFFPLFCAPVSHNHLSLSALFFGTFSVIHIHPPASVLMTHLILSCMYFCPRHLPSACGSDSTGQWSALLLRMQFISQITVVHATYHCHPAGSCHQSSHYFSLLYCLRTRGLSSVLAFPLLL